MRERLTILDLSDREFLLILDEAGDSDGWTDSLDVAKRLDMESRRSAASRLGWLSRQAQLVEREHLWDEHGNPIFNRKGQQRVSQRWRLTDLGRSYAYGRLKTAQRNNLDTVTREQMLEVTQRITEAVRTDPTAKWLMGREWRYGMAKT